MKAGKDIFVYRHFVLTFWQQTDMLKIHQAINGMESREDE